MGWPGQNRWKYRCCVTQSAWPAAAHSSGASFSQATASTSVAAAPHRVRPSPQPQLVPQWPQPPCHHCWHCRLSLSSSLSYASVVVIGMWCGRNSFFRTSAKRGGHLHGSPRGSLHTLDKFVSDGGSTAHINAHAGPELEADHSQSAHSELSPGAVGVMWLWPHPFMVWEDEGGTDSGIHPHMGPARVLT